MFRILLNCPHCMRRIAIEDARTEIPQPELNTTWRKFQLVYTVCPECRRGFRVTGERLGAAVLLAAVFAALFSTLFFSSLWPFAVVGVLLVLQKKVMQLFIGAAHA